MKNLIHLLVITSMLTACGGHTPNPVMTSQYGDNQKNCDALQYEISSTELEMNRIVGDTDKTGKNVALGVAGAFLIVPWFFMDFKDGEATEYQALRQRHENLMALAIDKKCGIKARQYPDIKEQAPSPEAPAYPNRHH